MRELRVIGLTPDSAHIVCSDPETGEKFRLAADEKLRAAARGDLARFGQIEIETEATMRPRDIQARIRAGASVEQVTEESGMPVSRVERFAYPVLLERARAAELAQKAHPVRKDGPAVETLIEVVSAAFAERGHNIDIAEWDAWKDEKGYWVAQLQWQAGRSVIAAHWRFQPDAHGGSVTPLDDPANDLVDPDFGRALRGLATILPEPAAEQPMPVEPVAPTPPPREEPATARTAVQEREPRAEEFYEKRAVVGGSIPVTAKPAPAAAPHSSPAREPAPARESAAREQSAPAAEYVAPSRETTPAREITAPVREQSAPAAEYAAPVRQPSAPAAEYAAPVREQSASAAEYVNPVRQPSAPAAEYAAPVREQSVSAAEYVNPVRQPSAPAAEYVNPVRQPSAPAAEYAAPVREQSVSAAEYVNPVRQPSAPAAEYVNPVRQPSAPAAEYAAPVREQSAPAAEYAAPAREYSTPAPDIAPQPAIPAANTPAASTPAAKAPAAKAPAPAAKASPAAGQPVAEETKQPAKQTRSKAKRGKAPMPSWEDVLLGVRSSGH